MINSYLIFNKWRRGSMAQYINYSTRLLYSLFVGCLFIYIFSWNFPSNKNIFFKVFIGKNVIFFLSQKEYFNQRRRWIPSTMANLIDFLSDFKHILKVNDRITYIFVLYIFINLVASLIAPSIVILMITDTLTFGFGISLLNELFLET